MDSEYLKLAVGDALSKALASVSLVKPADPIEYIGLWLAKYVENQQREQEAQNNAKKLEEERIQYNRKVEFARLKAEEDARIAREAEEARVAAIRKKRDDEFASYQAGQDATRADINAQIEESDRQKKNKDKVPPLHAQHTMFHYLTSFASSLSNQDLVSAKTVPNAVFSVVKAVLFLVGRKKREFQKWVHAKKLLKDASLASVNALAKQPIKKFHYASFILSNLPRTDLGEASLYVYVLYDWATAALALRRAALDLKDQASESTTTEEPLDPDAADEDDEEEEPEEQEDLEKYNVREADKEEEEEAPVDGEEGAPAEEGANEEEGAAEETAED